MSNFRTGRLSNEERDEIKEFVEQGLNYEQIASRLNRLPETIKNCVENVLMMNLSEETQIVKQAEQDIKKSPEWRNLEYQLTPSEQDTFIHHWREILAQFKGDVTHTERLQIIDVIRNEILINRVLEKIKGSSTDFTAARAEYMKEMSLPAEHRDVPKLEQIQMTMGNADAAVGRLTKEYKDLTERKQQALRDIKGTREQRIRRVEDSKESITSWVAALLDSEDRRRQLGLYMEKFRIAQKIEYERLSEYHKYEDGSLEQPILNSETLKEDNY